MPKKSRKVGRPTKYKPDYCIELIKHMQRGFSYDTFPAVIPDKVHLDTLYEWESKYPEFSEAKKIAFTRNRHFWEELGIKASLEQKQNFNAAVWIFNMKNRFGWKDKTETEHKGKIIIQATDLDESL